MFVRTYNCSSNIFKMNVSFNSNIPMDQRTRHEFQEECMDGLRYGPMQWIEGLKCCSHEGRKSNKYIAVSLLSIQLLMITASTSIILSQPFASKIQLPKIYTCLTPKLQI